MDPYTMRASQSFVAKRPRIQTIDYSASNVLKDRPGEFISYETSPEIRKQNNFGSVMKEF